MTKFPFDIVGFDVDGTLLDSHADLAHGINHALDLAGRPALPIDTLRSLIGGGGRTMLRRALELTGGVEDASFAQLHHQFLEHYAAAQRPLQSLLVKSFSKGNTTFSS